MYNIRSITEKYKVWYMFSSLYDFAKYLTVKNNIIGININNVILKILKKISLL